MTKSDAQNLDIFYALNCGKNLNYDLKTTQLLISSSLIHWFVVSGGHFQFIKKFLKFLSINKYFILFLLFIYLLMTNMQTSASKAFFLLCFIFFSERFKLNFNLIDMNIFSSLTCIIMDPALSLNLGLILSTICSTVVLLGLSPALTATVLYLCLMPVLQILQIPHFFSIYINLLISPFMEYIVFPLSIAGIIFKPLHSLADQILNILFLILEKLPTIVVEKKINQTNFMLFWLYIVFLSFLAKFYIQKKAKN